MSSSKKITRRAFVSTSAMALMATMPGIAMIQPSTSAMNRAEAHREELTALLKELISVRSISGEPAMEAQAVVKAYLSKLPYRIEESADRPSQYENHPEFMPPDPPSDGPFVNVVGWPKKSSHRQFAMFSHIDTHTIDEGWQTDPFHPAMVGTRLYGLGTSDDKGGVAAMLVAASALAKADMALPVVMSLHGKGGGSRGSLPVFARISKTKHTIGGVLYVHPAETGRGLEDVKNAVQGILDLQLTVIGWRGEPMEVGSIDSAAWEDGGNAVEVCWHLINRLRETVFKGVNVNVGIMNGGDRIGSVADKAVLTFRLKFEGDYTWAKLLAASKEQIAEYLKTIPASDNTYKVSLDTIGYRTNPGAASWNSEKSKILRDAIRDVTGKAPNAYPNHYAGDIRYPIRLLDVPAYGIGSVGGNFYGPNEWVDMDDLVRLVAVLIQTLTNWQKL